jgi:hypothetical protein
LGVKGKIEAENGSSVDSQKLIHAGKVLKDDSPLSEYNIKENDFLVVMVTKVTLFRRVIRRKNLFLYSPSQQKKLLLHLPLQLWLKLLLPLQHQHHQLHLQLRLL